MPLADEDVLFTVDCGELPVDPPAAAVVHIDPASLRSMTYIDERFPQDRYPELVEDVRRRLQRFIDRGPDVDGWGQPDPAGPWQLILRDHYLPDLTLEEPGAGPALEATEPGHSSA